MIMRLEKKVAIITGAGSGSGRSGVLAFAREGAQVVAADINAVTGEETVAMTRAAGGDALFVQVDCGKVEDMKKLVDAAMTSYGRIDILWNHAGIPGPGTIEQTEEEDFDRSLAVNIKGGFFATKFAIPHLKTAGGGSIIFTSSVSALRASPWSASYSLAKGGLISLVMALAIHLGPFNIRTNCLCPAGIDTPMLRLFTNRAGTMDDQMVEQAIKGLGEKSPLGRLASPEDIANVALFLASDEAAYLNGIALPIDGGKIVRY
jgi:NAD(P)-dependent dehydrogenase (short-subunit alcohol dehydrogenase family)